MCCPNLRLSDIVSRFVFCCNLLFVVCSLTSVDPSDDTVLLDPSDETEEDQLELAVRDALGNIEFIRVRTLTKALMPYLGHKTLLRSGWCPLRLW